MQVVVEQKWVKEKAKEEEIGLGKGGLRRTEITESMHREGYEMEKEEKGKRSGEVGAEEEEKRLSPAVLRSNH